MFMKYCTRGNIFILPVSCLSQGDSGPVYDDVSTVPKDCSAGQRVAAHREEEDDVQYASVQFKPNKKQDVPRQKEDIQYASVQFKTNNKQEVPSQKEDIQYASVQFKTNNKQEVPSQEEDIQYASVQFKKFKSEPIVPEKPSPGTPEEETQYASVRLSAATQ